MGWLKKSLVIFFTSFFMCVGFAQPQGEPTENKMSWSAWVHQLRHEAIKSGIRPDFFDQIFSRIPEPSPKVLHYYHTQPERRITFLEYRHSRADSKRIELGRQEFAKHHALLNKITHVYGVDPCFITALWGLETDYGHFMGSFPVIPSLATLAYDSKRPAFFRKELIEALRMVQDGQVRLEDFKGEWAGASGHPQFLPSSWYKYAVDFEGHGHKDIWKSIPDALASIANYLAKNGWRRDEPWADQVNLPAGFDQALIGKAIIKPVGEWRKLGVHVHGNKPWPNDQLPASIIQVGNPSEGGITLMMMPNFRVLQTWNDSNYYISTVGYLADQICHR